MEEEIGGFDSCPALFSDFFSFCVRYVCVCTL